MRSSLKRIAFIVLVGSIAFELSGCLGVMVSHLADGRPTEMSDEIIALRNSFNVASIGPVGRQLAYRPIASCFYNKSTILPNSGLEQSSIDVSLKPIKDKYLVVLKDQDRQKISTMLLSSNGRLFDFNADSNLDIKRFTPETYESIASQQTAGISASKNPHVINELTVGFPEYVKQPFNAGDKVGQITSEDGVVWGKLEYRGTLIYKNRSAALFDLTRVIPGYEEYGSIIYGFSVVDTQTTLPLLFVIDVKGFSRIEFEQSYCRG